MGLIGLAPMAELHFLLESQGKNLSSCLCRLLEAVHIPWLWLRCSDLNFYHHISFFDSLATL